jgi:hypothetical protein
MFCGVSDIDIKNIVLGKLGRLDTKVMVVHGGLGLLHVYRLLLHYWIWLHTLELV